MMEVTIDFPQEDERITSNLYTFRIGTLPQAAQAEISVDGGPWQSCRHAAGYWWFDWICYEPGEHRLTARAWEPGGQSVSSKPRRLRRAAA